jgi:SAM-dependent methyltransferase
MASFLGIGIGILLGRSRWSLPLWPFAVLLVGVVIVVTGNQLNVRVNSTDEIFFALTDASRAADTNYVVLPTVVALVAAVMAALAVPLGPLLKSMRPLRAYAIDISGSMAGIAAFTGMSAVGTSPTLWFTVVAALFVLLALGQPIGRRAAVAVLGAALGAALMLLAVVVVARGAIPGEIWSPYYRINHFTTSIGEQINVNGIPHQVMHAVAGPKEEFYNQVYQWFPGRTYANVLVVGAGSGSDAALALARGAGHVDAVEIDPNILQLGEQLHPDHPYQDPRVTAYVNDGRSFLRNTDKQYDLVIFALPDSLTLISTTANVRLESFLFTDEAFASVRDHLNPTGGVFVLYNYYRQPWLITKLDSMLTEAFGTPPLLRTYQSVKAAMADGPAVAALNGAPPPGDRSDPVPQDAGPVPQPATDDWPFLYLRTPFVADYYLVALAVIVLAAAAAVAAAARVTNTGLRRFSPHFFVLGAAFLLLETRSLVSFALLFGTTWLVNAFAFFGILAGVLLAILINARWPVRSPRVFYAGLFVALFVAFVLPPESLLLDPPWLRYLLAVLLAFAPVFFANLVFSYSFRDTRTADMAFASNLLGAMVGGALEYLALVTGYQALLVVVAGLYGLAWLFATRLRVGADRDLTIERIAMPIPADPAV